MLICCRIWEKIAESRKEGAGLQIDEYLTTGKVAALEEAGMKVAKAEEPPTGPAADAFKFA